MPILAYMHPVYQPAMRIISTITNSDPAIVTTTFDHNYIDGIIVRLIVPDGYGMTQANNLTGTIVVTSPTTFTIDINTTLFDAFTIPMVYPLDEQYSQVVPIGEVNETLEAATQNV